jgi:mRNA interferase RelE/StbE
MNGAATQIASRQFDDDFFRLPPQIRDLVQSKLDGMSARLGTFPHFRMKGSDKYRLRIGDYRVIYRFDPTKGEIYLVAIGHRREIYRDKS